MACVYVLLLQLERHRMKTLFYHSLWHRSLGSRRDSRPPAIIVGHPDAGFDITDVRDACDAYIDALALPQPLPNGTILNICSGVTRSAQSMAHDLLEVAGISASLEVDATIVCPSDLPSVQGNPAAARQALGWALRILWHELWSSFSVTGVTETGRKVLLSRLSGAGQRLNALSFFPQNRQPECV